MIRRPPRSTRTDTLFPYTTLFRSSRSQAEEPVVSASLGAEPILVNATRFRLANEVDWARLDRIVGTIEKKSVRALDDDDLLALPVLYRGALSSLSVARETSLDRALVRYLEQLRSEEHTSEVQSLMRISYAVF